METKFAPAERESMEVVLLQKAKIESSRFLDTVMAGTPFMFFILNSKRQVVYSNHLLMKYLGYSDLDTMAGFRPGELFSCVHASTEPGGCGTSESCRYCGAIAAVLESKKKSDMVIKDTLINVTLNGKEYPMNFEVSSKPFEWAGEEFFVVTMQNIAEKKRKEQLERTFFHDIINKAGNVSMILELLGNKGISDEYSEMFKLVKQGVVDMLEDIGYQRKLQEAENGELEIVGERLNVNAIMKSVIDEYRSFAGAYEADLKFVPVDSTFFFESDKVLIRRILGNLVKNAIEASKIADMVILSCNPLEKEIQFQVKNPAFMPVEVQMQMFNRSFSTKGAGRGIGTYSIKLFTEEYLKGRVDFTSEKENGTCFTVSFPWII